MILIERKVYLEIFNVVFLYDLFHDIRSSNMIGRLFLDRLHRFILDRLQLVERLFLNLDAKVVAVFVSRNVNGNPVLELLAVLT
jgi:hypothetical protein